MKYIVSVTRKNTTKITVEAKDRDEAVGKVSELCRTDTCAWNTCSFEYNSVKEKVKNRDGR